MFSSLGRLDIRIASVEGIKCLQIDERPAAEIQRQEELSILFALARVLGPLSAGATNEVVYICAEQPPEFLRRAVAVSGGTLQIERGPVLVYEGPLGHPEELANDAFRRLAQRVLGERNATLDERALEQLQQELMLGQEPDERVYWTRVAELTAVTGELLRAKFGGRWVFSPRTAAIPFAFRLGTEGPTGPILSNVAGRIERFLVNASRESPLGLLHGEVEPVPPGPEPKPVFPMLKASGWYGQDTMAGRPLVPWHEPRVAMPWLTYGEELPKSFGYFPKSSLQGRDLDALHAQALASLKTVSMKPMELSRDAYKLLAFIGPTYAAEKVLDADFMRGLHEQLGSPSLVVGIPRRTVLLVMDAQVEPSFLRIFCTLCEGQYTSSQSEPISPTPLLIEDGQLAGFVWARPRGAPRLVRAAELATAPPRGFFSRLFAWKWG